MSSVKELLQAVRGDKPHISEYDPENPQRFRTELKALQEWQKGASLRFFQQLLNIDKMTIAGEIFKKLTEFIDNDGVVPKHDTVSSYVKGVRKWNRETLFLVCMALGVNRDDDTRENAKNLFHLLGLTYARFADPGDIVFAWAVEKNYSFLQYKNLLEKAKPFSKDLEREWKKIQKGKSAAPDSWNGNDDACRAILGAPSTDDIENDFTAIWDKDEEALLEMLEDYKDDFHHCSILRARAVKQLCDNGLDSCADAWALYETGNNAIDESFRNRLEDILAGKAVVERDCIIALALDEGYSLSQLDQLLLNINFAPIMTNDEFVGQILSDERFEQKRNKKKNPLREIGLDK